MRYPLSLRDFWNPTREFAPWFQDMDDLFTTMRGQTFNPACDVEETDTHYLMSFDLPGIDKDKIKIEVMENQITVSGERKSEDKDDKSNRHVTERYYGEFKRVFALPAAIDGEKVEAHYKDGVLQIVVPKAESAKPRQIKISEGKGGLFSKLIGGQKSTTNEREVQDTKEVKVS